MVKEDNGSAWLNYYLPGLKAVLNYVVSLSKPQACNFVNSMLNCCKLGFDFSINSRLKFIVRLLTTSQPSEDARLAAENSAAQRIAYAKNYRSSSESVSVRCNNGSV